MCHPLRGFAHMPSFRLNNKHTLLSNQNLNKGDAMAVDLDEEMIYVVTWERRSMGRGGSNQVLGLEAGGFDFFCFGSQQFWWGHGVCLIESCQDRRGGRRIWFLVGATRLGFCFLFGAQLRFGFQQGGKTTFWFQVGLCFIKPYIPKSHNTPDRPPGPKSSTPKSLPINRLATENFAHETPAVSSFSYQPFFLCQ